MTFPITSKSSILKKVLRLFLEFGQLILVAIFLEHVICVHMVQFQN